MRGILIINGFIKNNKFNEFYNLIINGFKEKNITLDLMKNTDFNLDLLCDKVDILKAYGFILFFDKDIALNVYFQNCGMKVFNSAYSIALCDDKGFTHLLLQKENIKMPRTRFASFSYDNSFIESEKILSGFKFPLIVKERVGSLGEQVYLVNSIIEFDKLKTKLSSNILIQEYIGFNFHEDIRVYVVNHKVVGCCKRIGAENDFRANASLGGKMEEYEMNESFVELAERISKILRLDFGGLDFILGKNNEPIFIEANSNAQFLSFYKTFGVNIASYIADYILKKLS